MNIKVNKTYVDTLSGKMFNVAEIFVRLNEKERAETVAIVKSVSLDNGPKTEELIVDSKLLKNLQLINL